MVEVVVSVRRGRLPVPRADRLVFWEAVRAGLPWREAAVAAGAGRAAEAWFRAAGGVKGNGPGPAGGRFLSVAEREEIAVGGAAGEPLRVIAARLGRAPATVRREIRRNSPRQGREPAEAAPGAGEDPGPAGRALVAGADQRHAEGPVRWRAGDAGVARNHLPVAVRAGPGGAAPRAGGLPAHRAGAAQAAAHRR